MAKAIPFHEFCHTVCGITLTVGQTVLAKCVFGNTQPYQLSDKREQEIAKEMFGGILKITPAARRIVVLRLGRGSGKTTISAAYSIYTALTSDISRCGPGDVPVVVVVAPDKNTAKLSIRMAREMMRANQYLNNLVESSEDERIMLRRPDGRMVAIEAFAASRGGASVRGRSILTFLLDEAEFFQSDETGAYKVNDRDIYGALIPRLMPGGKGIFLSTPWPVETMMAELFESNFGSPKTATAVKATTLQMRGDDPEIRALVEQETERDPDNAEREFFCNVDRLVDGTFFDSSALSGSLDHDSEYPFPRNRLWPAAAACDFAFKSDSSALAIVQFDGFRYRTCLLKELRPRKGAPLKPSAVVKEFADTVKEYGIGGVWTDGHYREAIREHLQEHGLQIWDAPEGASGKLEVYSRTKAVLHEGRCVVPAVKEGRRLIEQAKTVIAKPGAGGSLSIKVPRRVGLAHGDLVSAWTLAVHALTYRQAEIEKEELPKYGTKDWFEYRTKQEKDAWEAFEKRYIKELEHSVRAEKTQYGGFYKRPRLR